MTSTLRPETAEQVAEVVAWAVSSEAPLEVVGAGSKRAVGRAVQAEATLDLSALDGITLYEPEELVLSARAATPLATIKAALAERGQELAFEPPDLSALLGGEQGAGTIGGALAANLSGPRRIKAGAARDHFLGVSAVSGRGEAFKSGGRVVKNVTGYDLCKGLAGSWGTLAVMTDVTVKVLPAAETVATLVLRGLDDQAAMSAMSLALRSPYEVSAAAHLPGAIVASLDTAGLGAQAGAATLIRIEGFGPSVSYRADRLAALVGASTAIETLDDQPSRALWRAIGDVAPFAGGGERPVWRLSVAPMAGAGVVAEIANALDDVHAFYDWGGGLVWLDLAPSDDAGAAAVRGAVDRAGGHATLIRAPLDLRAALDVFHPQDPGLAALSRRLKAGFDPHGILNPGRMYPA